VADDFDWRVEARKLREPTEKELEDYDCGIIDWREVLWVYKELPQEDMYLNNHIGSSIIVGLGKMNELDQAEETFQLTLERQVDRPNTYLLNSLLTACNRCNKPEKTLEWFQLHVASEEGLQLKPNRDSLRAVLVACGKMGDAQLAKSTFVRMLEMRFKPELQACNAVLRACIAANDVEGKQYILDLMVKCKIEGNAETTLLLAH